MYLFKKLPNLIQSANIKSAKAIGWLFVVFYIALILPCTYLVWTAYDQLKWESFHQTRQNALAFSQTITRPVINWIERESERPVVDYFYQTEHGLSAIAQQQLPDTNDGLVGYFQIDSNGQFTTPWLPQNLSNQIANIDDLQLKQALHVKLFSLVNQIQATPSPSRQVNKFSQDPRNLSISSSSASDIDNQSQPSAPATQTSDLYSKTTQQKAELSNKVSTPEVALEARSKNSLTEAQSANFSATDGATEAASAGQNAIFEDYGSINNQQDNDNASQPNLYQSFQQAAPAEADIAQSNLGQVQQLKKEQAYIERSEQARQRVSKNQRKANAERKRIADTILTAKAKKHKAATHQSPAPLKDSSGTAVEKELAEKAVAQEAVVQETESKSVFTEGSVSLETNATEADALASNNFSNIIDATNTNLTDTNLNSAILNNDKSSDGLSNGQSDIISDRLESLAVQKNRVAAFTTQKTPLQVQFLSDSHLVVFRQVTYQQNAFIQGFIINAERFFEQYFGYYFYQDSLSEHGDLLIAHNNNVMKAFTQQNSFQSRGGSASSAIDYNSRRQYALPEATLLSEYALNDTLKDFSLVYTIRALPPIAASSSILSIGGFLILMLTMSCWLMYVFTVKKFKLSIQQQNFVAAVSHELKTPLTSIRMYGEMLQQGWADQEKRQSYYQYIVDESERLTRLINNVLQLAKLSNKNLELNLKPIKTTEIVDLLKSRIAQQVKAADIELEINLVADCRLIAVNADSDALLQVLINLIDNAIKFSHPDDLKRIMISLEKTNKRLVIAVRDYGPGIETSQLNKVADLFYRAEDEMTRKTVGTGIGLSLVKQLVEAMNGNLSLMNADPGLCVQVSLPICSDSAAASN